jgi:hypothetical protein
MEKKMERKKRKKRSREDAHQSRIKAEAIVKISARVD